MPSFQVPVLSFAVRFLSPFPDSLPQLLVRCLPHALAFGLSPSGPLSFVRFPSGSGYSASVSSFPTLPGLASQRLFRCPFPLSLPRFPPSLRPDFSCLPSGFLYSALLMVSFRPSLIRSRSCSSGASLMLSLSVFPLPIRFLSSASLPVPATQPLFLPFRSSRLRLTAASPVRPSAFAFRLSPFFPARFPVPSFPVYVLGFL